MPVSNSIDSNITGLSFAREVANTPKTLPGSPVWKNLEPNDYQDFGGNITTVARDPINPTRQIAKGVTVDLEANGGFSMDYTQNNAKELMQSFFYIDALEKFSTIPLNYPFSGTKVAITSVDGTGGFGAASGLDSFKVNDIVMSSGFANSANNGVGVVTSAAGTLVDTDISTVVDASPATDAKVEVVGYQFPSGDLDLDVTGGLATLTSATITMTTLGLNVGEWIFIGGDVVGQQFTNANPSYGRIKSITATTIVLDKLTHGTATSDAGAGKTIRIYFSTFLRNAIDPADIKCHTVQLERTLGNDGVGVQSEYLVGAFANQFNLNTATADKLTSELSFVALDHEQRDGTTGVKSGAHVAALAEDAFNTSSNVYRSFMSIVDNATLNPTAFFAYISEFNLSIENTVNPLKAIGTLGAFGVSLGKFQVTGSITAYFSTVAATQAIRNNDNVTVDVIFAKQNAGFVFDIGLLTVGGGIIQVEKDQAITVPLDVTAAQNPEGYTLGLTHFNYLPSVAMPA